MTRDLHSKVRFGLIWSLISSWGNKLLVLLLFMVLARVLSPRDMGVFSAALVVFNFLALFVDQGLAEAIVQKKEINERQLNVVFIVNLIMAVTIFIALWFGAPTLALAMSLPELVDILRVGSVSILLGAVCFSQQAMHRRNFNYRWLAICLLVSTTVGGGAAIIFALNGYGPWSLVVQTVVSSGVTTAMLWAKPQWKLSFSFDFHGVRDLFGYGLNRLGTNVLDFAYSRYIEIFLAAVLGPAALGIYSVGVRVYQALMQALSGAILDVAHNGFSRLAHEPSRLQEAYYRSMKVTSAIAVPAFLMLSALSPEVVWVLFGGKWIDSADVMKVMCLLGAVQVMQFYNGTAFHAIGRPSISLVIAVFKALTTLVLLLLVRDKSMAVIVYAYVGCQLASAPLSFILARHCIGISLKRIAKEIAPFVAASLAAVGVGELIRHMSQIQTLSPHLRLAILGFSVVSCYAAIIAVLARKSALEVLSYMNKKSPGKQ